MAERPEHARHAALRGAISLAMNACAIALLVPRSSIPGTRFRLTFHRDKECPWQDLHPHCIASEAIVSAVGLHGHNWMVGYPGAAPGSSCFQGKRVLLALSYPMKSGRAP